MLGCIDATAYNYDSSANTDNGTCIAYVFGCMDSSASNYNEFANEDDGSCIAFVYGCTDATAFNYSASANTDDGSCVEMIFGCTDFTASNYNTGANTDDGSCVSIVEGCMDNSASNYNPNANSDDDSCIVPGCIDASAENYNANATIDNGSCVIYGCIWNTWFVCPESYDPNATVGDWSYCSFTWDGCAISGLDLPSIGNYPFLRVADLTDDIIDAYYYLGDDKVGCMDKFASNYLRSAVLDDETCMYLMPIVENKLSINLYPQPAISHITIDYVSSSVENTPYLIQDINGKIIIRGELEITGSKKINLNNMSPGNYYFQYRIDNKSITHKFVIQ